MLKATAKRCHGVSIVAVALLQIATTGCGSGGIERVPVSGSVTFGGGEWPTEGVLYFNPVDPADGSPHGNGIAHFDRSGRYTVKSPAGDAAGLFPGTYRIGIECWKVRPNMAGGLSNSFVPQDFVRSNDRLTVHVIAGSPLVYNFDVPQK